jgi:alcohol dehydrogenase-like protein
MPSSISICRPPALRPRDLLVRVEAISVNPVDVKVRASAAPPEGEPRILGYDAVGIVEAAGPECRLFKKSDAVFYAGVIDRPGTNAELHAVDERIVGPKPESLTAAQAAALPLTWLTASEPLLERLGRTLWLEDVGQCDADRQWRRRRRLDPHPALAASPAHRDRYSLAAGNDGLVWYPHFGKEPRLNTHSQPE